MNERIKEVAIKAQVEHCISHVRLQEFADLIIEMCADHILNTSDRYRKEYFAHKVLELRSD